MPEFDTLGRAVRWIREEKNLKQLDLANAAGITRTMLSAYERGKVQPTLESLDRILMALDCDLIEFARTMRIIDPPHSPGELPTAEGPWQDDGGAAQAETRAFRDLSAALQRWLETLRQVAYAKAPEQGAEPASTSRSREFAGKSP